MIGITLVYETMGRKREIAAKMHRKHLSNAKKIINVLLIAIQVFAIIIGDKNEFLKYVELFSMVRLLLFIFSEFIH